MAAWLDRTLGAGYSGSLPPGSLPARTPNISDPVRMEILVDGENILGACIIEYIIWTRDSGAGTTAIYDKTDAISGPTVWTTADASGIIAQPYGLWDVGPTLFKNGFYVDLPGFVTGAVAYR